MKPESRAALLKAQAAIEDAYRVCLEEAIGADTHDKRVKITQAIRHLPEFSAQLAEMVDPKPPHAFEQWGQQFNPSAIVGGQLKPQLHTQGGGIVKDTAAW